MRRKIIPMFSNF